MILLEQATPAQLEQLAALEQVTWEQTFAHLYTPADFHAYMQAHKTPAAIIQKLARPGTQCWIAWENATALGFITVNGDKQPDENGPLPGPVMELEQIYVHPDHKGKGIGTLLMQQLYRIAAAAGVRTLWLGVWENNLAAQQFYRKEGFERFGAHIFRVGQAEDTDWLLQKTLY